MKYIGVKTLKRKCPICGKPDWCSISENGELAICMRIEGTRKTANDGNLHILTERTRPVIVEPPQVPDTATLFDAQAYYDALVARHDWTVTDGLASDLKLDPWQLDRLGPVYDERHKAFAFPMRTAAGRVSGLRLRNLQGRKWTVRGSKDGLFYDPAVDQATEAYVCEGPTDTAAALSLGLFAIGRPSCRGAVPLIRDLARRLKVKKLTIIADNDSEKRHMSGGFFEPGVDGAESLLTQLGMVARVVIMPDKDIRQWVADGGTRRGFDRICSCFKFRLS